MCVDYFGHSRTEIAPLLPNKATKILDIGCGRGATSLWLKSLYPDARFVGVEGNESLRSELAKVFDEVHIADLNQGMPVIASADLVLLLDVLEHTVNPEEILRKIVASAANDAVFIVSLPNVAHLSVSAPLFLQGRFDYQEAGILDRTHLRFFVRGSAIGLLNAAGLQVLQGIESGLGGPKTRLLDRLTLGLLRDRLVKQYIMKGAANSNKHVQAEIPWA